MINIPSSNYIEVKNAVEKIGVLVSRLRIVSSFCLRVQNWVAHCVALYIVGFQIPLVILILPF